MKKLFWSFFLGILLLTGAKTFAESSFWIADDTISYTDPNLNWAQEITVNPPSVTAKDTSVTLSFQAETDIQKEIILANVGIGIAKAENLVDANFSSFWVPKEKTSEYNAYDDQAIEANLLAVVFEKTSTPTPSDGTDPIIQTIQGDHEFNTWQYLRATISVNGRVIHGPFADLVHISSTKEKKMIAVYAAIGTAIAQKAGWFTGVWDPDLFQIPDSAALFQRFHGQDATRGTFLGQETSLTDYTGISSTGTDQMRNILKIVVDFLKKAMVPIAILLMTYNGLSIYFAWKDENKINEKLNILIGTMMGFLFMTLAVHFVDWVIFGREGEILRGEVDTADFALRGVAEVGGVFDLFMSFLAIIAVAFIVINSVFLITAGANDESKETEIKKRIFFSIMGLILIISIRPIITTFTTESGQLSMPDVTGLISLSAKWINFLLGFVGVLAVVSLIYGGVKMIAHFGDESQVEDAKKVIIASLIGIVLAFSAWALVYYFAFAGAG